MNHSKLLILLIGLLITNVDTVEKLKFDCPLFTCSNLLRENFVKLYLCNIKNMELIKCLHNDNNNYLNISITKNIHFDKNIELISKIKENFKLSLNKYNWLNSALNLSLNNLNLTKIPNFLRNKYLYLKNNLIKEIKEIDKNLLKNLQLIDLTGNPIYQIDKNVLKRLCSHNTLLRNIQLRSLKTDLNIIKDVIKSVTKYCNNKLSILDLRFNNISIISGKWLILNIFNRRSYLNILFHGNLNYLDSIPNSWKIQMRYIFFSIFFCTRI